MPVHGDSATGWLPVVLVYCIAIMDTKYSNNCTETRHLRLRMELVLLLLSSNGVFLRIECRPGLFCSKMRSSIPMWPNVYLPAAW